MSIEVDIGNGEEQRAWDILFDVPVRMKNGKNVFVWHGRIIRNRAKGFMMLGFNKGLNSFALPLAPETFDAMKQVLSLAEQKYTDFVHMTPEDLAALTAAPQVDQ